LNGFQHKQQTKTRQDKTRQDKRREEARKEKKGKEKKRKKKSLKSTYECKKKPVSDLEEVGRR
jgi:hypothetical protein